MKNYFRVFSTEFLFIFGDINFRHSIQGGFGVLYWPDVIFLILGIFYLINIKEKEIKRLIFGWLLLAPIPAVLTRDGGNHATRLILMLLPLLILISFGAYQLLEGVKEKRQKIILRLLFILVYFVPFILYLHRYYVHYPVESEEWWHCGFKEVAEFTKKEEKNYQYIVISDRDQPPLIFSLFWLGIDPKIVQENKLEWTKINDYLTADHLPGTKYYFGHVSEERIKNYWPQGTLTNQILYLSPLKETIIDFRYNAVPGSLRLLGTVYLPSGRVARYILTGN